MRKVKACGAVVVFSICLASCSPAGARDKVSGIRAWAERGAFRQEDNKLESFAREYSVGGNSQPFERWPTETEEAAEPSLEPGAAASPKATEVAPAQ